MREERKLERRVADKALRLYGVPSYKMEPPLGSETGWPDRMFFIRGGRPFFIEFKAPGEEPTAKQNHIMQMLEDLGYDVAWTDDEEAALSAIKTRVEQGRP